jgi:hypothetical protein
MKVGDLVRCKYAVGKPIGVIIASRRIPGGNGALVFDVFIKGRIWPGREKVLEVVK